MKDLAKKPKGGSARKRPTKSASGSPGTSDVDEFLRDFTHPLKPEVLALRAIILGAHPKVAEGIKWKSPSFRLDEYFATLNIRKDVIIVVLHQGAKVKDNSAEGPKISDPAGLLEWPAKDRAIARFTDMKAIEANKTAFEKIVRQWIDHVR